MEWSYFTKTLQLERGRWPESREGGRGRGKKDGRGDRRHEWKRECELWQSPLTSSPCPSLSLSVCLSVLLFHSHLAPDPLLVWVVKMGCSCGEGSYGALTERLFLPVTRTKTHTHAHTPTHTHTIKLKTKMNHLELTPFSISSLAVFICADWL